MIDRGTEMDINRKTAYEVLHAVESRGQYSNIALNSFIKKNRPDSQGFVRELVYGVIENRMYLDYVISKLIRGRLRDVRRQDRIILEMGLYQIAEMDSVPDYAAVDESVRLAKKYAGGREKFINGVLRSYLRDRDSIKLPDREDDTVRYLSLRYSYPIWMIELWLEKYSEEEVEKLLAAGNERPPVTLRVNSSRISREELLDRLHGAGYTVSVSELCETGIYAEGEDILDTQEYREGLFSVQDEASQIAVEYLAPEEGELVCDVCAAPGGKSLASAERMKNTGKVISQDIYSRKVEGIAHQAERLGLANVETFTWDAEKFRSDLEGICDRVIADVPCSGLGVIRRKPEIKYAKKKEEIMTLPEKQLSILETSGRYVKNGGILLYSTCTVNHYENEKVVEKFLENSGEFEKIKEVQLLPSVEGCDGFYICVMMRKKQI